MKRLSLEMRGWKAAALLALVSVFVLVLAACASSTTSDSPASESNSSSSDSSSSSEEAPVESDKIDLSTVTLDPQNPVTIEYWHYFTDTRGGPSIRQWVEEFEAEHPEIKVIEKYNETPKLTSNIQTASAAGSPPDVVVSSSFELLIDALGAIPMDRFLIEEEFWDDYYPNVLEFGQMDGRQVSVPYAYSTYILYYNADLFREAGLNPDVPPETWQEMRDYAIQIKDKTGKWGYFPVPHQGLPVQIPMMINGANLFDENDQATFASPEGEEAVQFIYDMATKDQTVPYATRPELTQAFNAGEIAMYLATSASLNSLREGAQFELRTAKTPAFEGKPLRVVNGGSNFLIMTHDLQKQKAAWEWIKFLSSPEILAEWTKVTGYLPPKQNILENPDLLKSYVESDPLFQAAVDMIPHSIKMQKWPGYNEVEIEGLFVDYYDAMMTGKMEDSVAALHELQEDVNQLLP